MDAKYLEFLEKRKNYNMKMDEIHKSIEIDKKKAEHYAKESERITNCINNVDSILNELKNEFKNNTKLNQTDMTFLFVATALQCIRWIFQPKVSTKFEQISKEQRTNATKDGNKFDYAKSNEAAKYFDKVKESYKYPNSVQILTHSVPYDVVAGTEHVVIPGVTTKGTRLCANNHHAATYGHDPVAGYIIGTMNILTSTVTYRKPTFETEIVCLYEGSIKDTYVLEGNIGIQRLIKMTSESVAEDPNRLIAAIIKQKYHMRSDKYTKQGLPIPFIPADKAQELLKDGWNSNELERFSKHIAKNVGTISIQATLSLLINTIIETLYKLVDDGAKPEIKEVKARKIIMYSNTIASTSNVIYTAISKNLNNLDIGGLLVTVFRIATDTKIINEIKREYIYGGFEKQLELREFNLVDYIYEEE